MMIIMAAAAGVIAGMLISFGFVLLVITEDRPIELNSQILCEDDVARLIAEKRRA